MTSAATEVSLHCIICYEEFDLKDRHPVVLPCGHTYVCIVCAKRLKKCMECREPLFWNPPKAPYQHTLPSHHRSPAHPRYPSRTVGRMSAARYSSSPQTPPHPSMATATSNTANNSASNATGAAMDDALPLPLPKNLVLMEMIEAKERQQRLLREARRQEQELLLQQVSPSQKLQQRDNLRDEYSRDDAQNLIDSEADDDDEDEEEWLVDPALSGMAAFSGSCGTYVVREPLGLVVLPQDPNRRHQQPASPQSLAARASTKTTAAMEVTIPPYPLPRKAPQPPPTTPDQDEKKEHGPEEGNDHHDAPQPLNTGKSYHHPQPFFNSDEILVADGEKADGSFPDAAKTTTTSLSVREPFSIQEGQMVQVVGVDEGVYQLARGAGYIVATVNQLVKVGGPLETSCKLEGMLQSVTRKQLEVRSQLEEINRLARGLREKIVLEQANPEQHPVINPPKNTPRDDGQLLTRSYHYTLHENSHPTTPTRHRTANDSSPTTGGSDGNQSTQSNTSTHVELGAPRTPGPPQSSVDGPFLEMGNGSGSGSYAGYDQYVDSPAHSCPMPSVNATPNLIQPFIDGTPAGLPRYRVNSDDDMYGMGWAGALGCGSSLFGERLLESSRHGASNILNAAGNDILALSFDEHSILDHPTTRNRAAVLAVAAGAHTGLQDSPLRSGGSFDGVNFRTGMSGHSGVSQPKRNRNAHHTGLIHSSGATLPPRQIRMMSEHRGVAHVRGSGPSPGLKRRTTPDTMVGSQDYY